MKTWQKIWPTNNNTHQIPKCYSFANSFCQTEFVRNEEMFNINDYYEDEGHNNISID